MPALAQAPAAHVHGIARLEVAIDGDTLTLGLESPLDSLLGFEHLPRTDKERAAVRGMADKLGQPEKLFVMPAAAGCAAVSTKLASPVLGPARTDGGAGHADLDGEFVFRCKHPQALHAIDVAMFAVFPHLQRMDVQVAGPRGQIAARLTASQPRLNW